MVGRGPVGRLSLQHHPEGPSSFIGRLAGTERVVADFLIEEVLDQQSAEMVEFLEATSVVDEFDVELANSLLGDSTAHTSCDER